MNAITCVPLPLPEKGSQVGTQCCSLGGGLAGVELFENCNYTAVQYVATLIRQV